MPSHISSIASPPFKPVHLHPSQQCKESSACSILFSSTAVLADCLSFCKNLSQTQRAEGGDCEYDVSTLVSHAMRWLLAPSSSILWTSSVQELLLDDSPSVEHPGWLTFPPPSPSSLARLPGQEFTDRNRLPSRELAESSTARFKSARSNGKSGGGPTGGGGAIFAGGGPGGISGISSLMA